MGIELSVTFNGKFGGTVVDRTIISLLEITQTRVETSMISLAVCDRQTHRLCEQIPETPGTSIRSVQSFRLHFYQDMSAINHDSSKEFGSLHAMKIESLNTKLVTPG